MEELFKALTWLIYNGAIAVAVLYGGSAIFAIVMFVIMWRKMQRRFDRFNRF